MAMPCQPRDFPGFLEHLGSMANDEFPKVLYSVATSLLGILSQRRLEARHKLIAYILLIAFHV